jgi:endonuclease/exonuclease/phosphatase family metal-dependent hydrolase
VINTLDADVVAIQEIDKRLGARPSSIARGALARGADFQIAALARNDVSLGWHGNAVVVRRGQTILGVDHITLPGLEPCGAVRVEVGAAWGRLSIVGVHLGLMRRHRRAQLAAIRVGLAEEDVANAVILGDFNEWSGSKGMEPLAPDFDIVSPGKSFHSAYPLAALDRIALGANLTLTDAGVGQGKLARIASDHLPIRGDVIRADA